MAIFNKNLLAACALTCIVICGEVVAQEPLLWAPLKLPASSELREKLKDSTVPSRPSPGTGLQPLISSTPRGGVHLNSESIASNQPSSPGVVADSLSPPGLQDDSIPTSSRSLVSISGEAMMGVEPWRPFATSKVDFDLLGQLLLPAEIRELAQRASVARRPEATMIRPMLPVADSRTAPDTSVIQDSNIRSVGYESSWLPQQEESKQDDKNSNDAEDKVDDKELKSEKQDPEDTTSLIDETKTTKDVKSEIQRQIALVKNNESLDDTAKAEQLKPLTSANSKIEEAISFESQIQSRHIAIKEFENAKIDLESKLATTEEGEVPDETRTASELQVDLARKRAEYQEKKDQLELIENLSKQQGQRTTELPGLKTAAAEALKAVNEKEKPEDLASALNIDSMKLEAQKKLEFLNKDFAWQVKNRVLLPLRRSLIDKELKVLEANIDSFEKAYTKRRNDEIKEQQKQARDAVLKADPELSKLALRNQELVKVRGDLATASQKSTGELERIEQNIDDLKEKLDAQKDRIETVSGTSNASGMELVKFRHNLMYTFKSQQRIEEIIQQRQVIRLEELKLEEQERELASSQEEKQAENASELLATQRAYLQELLVDYKSFDNQLVTEKEALLRLVKDVREARAYIDKQSLWLQSSRPLGFSDLGKLGNAFQSFFNRGKWNDLAVAVKHRVASAPYNAALAGFLLLGMFVVSRRLREQA
ncbi:MAG: hypothetical protein ACI87E_001091 [Mariniblastus sp.]